MRSYSGGGAAGRSLQLAQLRLAGPTAAHRLQLQQLELGGKILASPKFSSFNTGIITFRPSLKPLQNLGDATLPQLAASYRRRRLQQPPRGTAHQSATRWLCSGFRRCQRHMAGLQPLPQGTFRPC